MYSFMPITVAKGPSFIFGGHFASLLEKAESFEDPAGVDVISKSLAIPKSEKRKRYILLTCPSCDSADTRADGNRCDRTFRDCQHLLLRHAS